MNVIASAAKQSGAKAPSRAISEGSRLLQALRALAMTGKTTFKLYRAGKDYIERPHRSLRRELKKRAPLVTFDYQKASRGEHWISISTPELTSVCPFTDYPDFGRVKIEYIPNKKCLELKAFKLYINAFRDVKIFHETITEVIFADFLEAVRPKKAWIEVKMNPRGNVKTVCRKYYKMPARMIK